MRVYPTLLLAASEIQRDIKKSAAMGVSRVQQWDNVDLLAQEALGYMYAISPDGIPKPIEEIINIGTEMGMSVFTENINAMRTWLHYERQARLNPEYPEAYKASEDLHPALAKVFEGKWPSYTYRERLVGMIPSVYATLTANKDSRRAYWGIWNQTDNQRQMAPTRVPCSLGYHFLIRTLPDGTEALNMIYSQRSSDFDTFWLSDVWLANQMQHQIAYLLEIPSGVFIHSLHSFHSFKVGEQEIY